MKETKFVRKGAVIRDLSSGQDTKFDSINAAKRESRRLQGSQMGQGLVKVVDKFD